MELKAEIQGTLFARQEIFDHSGKVIAYELLYRGGNGHCSDLSPVDTKAGDNATSFVISHLFTHLDLDLILGKHPAFINFTRKNLLDRIPNLLPKQKVVIEILEDAVVDEELLEIVHSLSQRGYKIALDDFVYNESLAPLIKMADIIKIDVLNLSEQEVIHQLSLLKDFKGKLLAEKVESREQYAHCKELGFHFFQGYFFNKPDVIHGEKISENKTYLLKLMAELHDPDIPMQRVEEVILQIPKLSYRILRLANSALLYAGKKIDSLLEAIQQLGLIQIRDWINLLLVSSLNDVNQNLLERTLIRAKMCNALARMSGIANAHLAYTVGMLSTLDGILNEPMESLLSKISLSEELNNALLHKQGDLGYVLSLIQYYEKGQFDKIIDPRISPQTFSLAYLEGIEYANEVLALLN